MNAMRMNGETFGSAHDPEENPRKSLPYARGRREAIAWLAGLAVFVAILAFGVVMDDVTSIIAGGVGFSIVIWGIEVRYRTSDTGIPGGVAALTLMAGAPADPWSLAAGIGVGWSASEHLKGAGDVELQPLPIRAGGREIPLTYLPDMTVRRCPRCRMRWYRPAGETFTCRRCGELIRSEK